jgi:alkanesulfonate monooxygenase SsuD/methylene tetrahydromethanopterin reductase-like flavin-dependent oxidoreductase (luciferase family)
MVTAPFLRHPMMTARAMLSLANLTGGRVAIGLGLGGSAVASIGRRPATLQQTRDYLMAVRDLLNGESVTWDGVTTAPLVNAEHIPIYLAAEGPKALRLAGEIADGVIVTVGLNHDVVTHSVETARSGATDAGRRPDDLTFWGMGYVSVRDTYDQAIDDIAAFLAVHGGLGMQRAHAREMVPPELKDKFAELMAAYSATEHVVVGAEQSKLVKTLGLTDYLAGLTAIAGTPEQVRDCVSGLEKLGVSCVLAPLPGNVDPDGTLRRFRDAVAGS